VLYLRKVLNDCISPGLLGGGRWTHLWFRPHLSKTYINIRQGKPASVRKPAIAMVMEELKQDVDANLIYGAVVLKVYLAAYKQRKKISDVPTLYRYAIAEYNGEERLDNGIKHKYVYRDKVLKYARK